MLDLCWNLPFFLNYTNTPSLATADYVTFNPEHPLLFFPAVVKPTEVPTEPPTLPPPATVPPALDGEESFDNRAKIITFDFADIRLYMNILVPASQCAKVPKQTWSSSLMVPGVLEMRALTRSSSLSRA